MQLDDILIFLFIAGSIITSIVRGLNEQNKKKPPQQGQGQQGQGQQGPQTGLPKQTVQPTQPGQPTQGDLQQRLEEARRRVQRAMEQQTNRGGEGEATGRAPAPPPLIGGGLEGTSLEGQTKERGTLEGGATLTGRGTLESGGSLQQSPEPKRQTPNYTFSETEKDVFRPIDPSNRNPSDFQQQMSTAQPFMGEISHQGKPQLSEAATVTRWRQRVPTNAPKHAKIGGSELLAPEMLTEKELLRGFLWQQILSQPRSKAKLRTYPVQKPRV